MACIEPWLSPCAMISSVMLLVGVMVRSRASVKTDHCVLKRLETARAGAWVECAVKVFRVILGCDHSAIQSWRCHRRNSKNYLGCLVTLWIRKNVHTQGRKVRFSLVFVLSLLHSLVLGRRHRKKLSYNDGPIHHPFLVPPVTPLWCSL